MIELDSRYHEDTHEVTLANDLLRSLPRPLAQAVDEIEGHGEPQVRLQELCLSLIPMTFQLLALTLSSEYLASDAPPSADATDSLHAMVRRPGPGKWLAFIREVVAYFAEHRTAVVSSHAMQALHTALVAKKRPQVRITEGDGDGRRLAYADALVNLRNRFAHSRHISRQRAESLGADHLTIWKALISLVAPLFEARLLVADATGEAYRSLDGRPFDPHSITPGATGESLLLWNESSGANLRLHPLLIALHDAAQQHGEALLLEEVKGKQLLYLNGDELVRRREEFRELVQLLEARTPRVEGVSSADLSTAVLGERIDRVTTRTLSAFEDTLKYLPAMFVPRPGVPESLDRWLEAAEPGCILAGEAGTGKTSLVADWVVQRRQAGDHLLLVEAAKLEDADLPRMVEQVLGLDSPLRECLDRVFGEGGESTRFIVVIDGANEFVGHELEGRGMLWREINSLVERFDGYRPRVKCLVTTRSDVWERDFPRAESADRVLKRRLFCGDGGSSFPTLTVGTLDPTEAQAIYERARREVPGMAPETAGADLPPPVKQLIRQPFLLRLVLQTFNGREVPAVSERALLRRFALDKALAQREQREVMFALLERMSELHKTEVSLDELLYGKQAAAHRAGKQPKRGKRERSIEEIVLDPRPASPYRRLMDEGLIEERVVGEGEAAEERLAFAQEKVTNLMYGEFKRRRLRVATKAMLVILAVLTTLAAFVVVAGPMRSQRRVVAVAAALQDSTLEVPAADRLIELTETMLQVRRHVGSRSVVLIFALVFGCFALFAYNVVYAQIWSSQLVATDLPTRFLKERLWEKVVKWSTVVGIPFGLASAFLGMMVGKGTLQVTPSQVFAVILIIVCVGVPISIALSAIAVVRYGRTPQAVYTLFGRHQVKTHALGVVFILPSIVAFILVTYMAPPHALGLEPELLQARDALASSPELAELRHSVAVAGHGEEALELIDQRLARVEEMVTDDAEIRPAMQALAMGMSLGLAIQIPLYWLATLLLAAPLEAYMRRRTG